MAKWKSAAAAVFLSTFIASPDLAAAERVKVVRKTEPVYPLFAKRQGIEGFVVVRFTVERDGTVSKPEVVSAIPENVFEEAAVACVMEWLYEPPAERVRDVMVEIRFRL